MSWLLLILLPALLPAQTAVPNNDAQMAAVLARLDRLEQQNADLAAEVRSLRTQLSGAATALEASTSEPAAGIEERVSVVENRVEEQSQSKVDAAQRFPIKLKGLVLFNAFMGSRGAAAAPAYGPALIAPDRSGATLLQSLIGFDFNGPELPGNGRLSASLNLDFYGGASTQAYSLRIRRGVLNFDWEDRSFSVGSDKPLISQRAPDSLAEVVYPPLADAGNPWQWVPQARFAEHIQFGDQAGIEVQAAVLETSEGSSYAPPAISKNLDPTRPAVEGRLGFWRGSGETRFEIAPGFHVSTSHLYGYSVPSRFGTIDWLIKPAKWMQVTGLLVAGDNTSVFGGFNNGVVLRYQASPVAAREIGGWTQFAFPITARLTLNAFGGLQAPQTANLYTGMLTHASTFAFNVRYQLTPNLLLGAEALQARDGFQDQPHVIRNHYDVAIGYLF